jgi:hypothetical protein
MDNIKLFKQAFYEINKAEKRKEQLYKSTIIYPNFEEKLQKIDKRMDGNLRIIFNDGLNNLKKIQQEQVDKKLNGQNVKLQ